MNRRDQAIHMADDVSQFGVIDNLDGGRELTAVVHSTDLGAWLHRNLSGIVSQHTYTTVYEAARWGYDWAVVSVFRRSDGAWAVAHGSGCSCDGWEAEHQQAEAEYTFNRSEVYERFRAGLGEHRYDFDAAAAFEHEDKMRVAVNAQ